ncbi:hypothetical protein Dda_3489 [Drechslerella dactyloides]|uniref:Rhodopsin domain-containing protein n=1 Tax=Drechslerella dactyloides TaxID=74499 RepID=A0AAD6J5W8_DREDA|nr:hypothetical protein Dda_3489 [Drechslerella dactyloides]
MSSSALFIRATGALAPTELTASAWLFALFFASGRWHFVGTVPPSSWMYSSITARWPSQGKAPSYVNTFGKIPELMAFLLRLVARLLVQRDRVNIGDVLLVFAWLALSMMASCDTWLLKLRLMTPDRTYNQDLTQLSNDPETNVLILKIVYGSIIPYYTGVWLVKCTILSFYYTIIPTSLSTYRKALHVVMAGVLASMATVLCINIFWCLPIRRNWSLSRDSECLSFATIPVFIISTACNILTDMAILILPLPLLRNIKFQHRSQLTGIAAVFALGCFAMLASVVRVATLADTAILTHVAVWSSVEVAVGIAVASVPSIRTLVRKNRGSIGLSIPSLARDQEESAQSCTNSSRPGGAKDWISMEEGEMDTLKSRNRDTIKSHSTVITVPTVEELEEIRCEDGSTIRSINDLQRFHDSVLLSRNPNDASPRLNHEWSFDKVQWRYTEPEPPGPINVHGLGVIPDVPPLPPLRTVHISAGLR